MCKVMALTKTKKFFKRVNEESFINYAAKALLKSQRDGFGYAMRGEKGNFGERSCKDEFETLLFTKHGQPKFVDISYQNHFGKKSIPVGGAIFHGRTSTNKGGLKNTHPINKSGWTLVHNGVVSNEGPKYEQATDNDTEHLVHYMATKELGIEGIEKHITGYYAFAALDPEGNLHIVKDSRAWLHVTWLPELDTYFFATTKDLIEDICKAFDILYNPIHAVKDNSYMVFDKNGLMTNFKEIKPKGSTARENWLANRSMNYNTTSSYPYSGRHYHDDYSEDWSNKNWGDKFDTVSKSAAESGKVFIDANPIVQLPVGASDSATSKGGTILDMTSRIPASGPKTEADATSPAANGAKSQADVEEKRADETTASGTATVSTDINSRTEKGFNRMINKIANSIGINRDTDDMDTYDMYEEQLNNDDVAAQLASMSEYLETIDDPAVQDSLRRWADEVCNMNNRYTVLDLYDRPISHEDFNALELEEQILCTIIRPDDTVINPWDYDNDLPYDRTGMGNA